MKKYIAAIGICFMALGAACIMKTDPEEVGEELPELIIMSHIIIWMTMESRQVLMWNWRKWCVNS